MKSLVLSAGAGTGKTHALVRLALRLYAGADGEPVDPERVWAVTFTDKAAAELRGRILSGARELARGGAEEGLPLLAPGRWEEIARMLSSAPIGTFHALCAGLLRDHAGEAGVAPGFTILEEGDALELFERSREEVLLRELGDPSGSARRLVRELGGLDRLRQALTGLSFRLAEEGRDPPWLVEDPAGAPLPAFDTGPGPERLARACAGLAAALDRLGADTHPRLAGPREVLARERSRLGRCEPEALARWYAAAKAVASASAGRGQVPAPARGVWDAVKESWDEVREALASGSQARVGRDLAGLLARVAFTHATDKRRAGVLDFGDLVRRARDLLRDRRDVRKAVKERVGALLVDEFQDTNAVQLDLIHLLGEERSEEREIPAAGRAADLPLERGVLRAVGDRKQAIYEFRGADVSIFAELIDRARHGDGYELDTLQQSRRSLPGIVRFVNEVVGPLLKPPVDRPLDAGFLPTEDALVADRVEPPEAGFPAVELLESDGSLSAAERRRLEAALVARHVEMLLASARPVELAGEVRPVRGGDVALLLRSFGAVETYRRALAERGIPSVVLRGRGFFGAREVRDLSALLLAIADPRDTFASAAVLRSPLVGISDDALVLLAVQHKLDLAAHAAGCAAEVGPDDARKLDLVGPLVARLAKEIDRLGADGVLELALAALGGEPVLAASFEGEQRLANVRKLMGWVAARRGAGALALAQELLARADDRDDREPPAEVRGDGGEAVQVMTIHGAKGLEFPVVVLPELGFADPQDWSPVLFDRLLGLAVRSVDPLGERLLDAHGRRVKDDLDARRDAENGRLLYVATTRARDLLVLCGEGRQRTWRAKIESRLEGRPGLVVRIPPGTLEDLPASNGGAAVPVEPLPPPPAPEAAPLRGLRRKSRASPGQLDLFVRPGAPAPPAPGPVAIPALTPLQLAPATFVSAVTELSDLVRCRRRFFYKQVAGLEEFPGRTAPPDAEPDDLDRLERGQLAHRILERVDLAWAATDPDGAVEAAFARDPDRAAGEARAVGADVRAFLGSPLGRSLAGAPRVYREMPFVLEVATPGRAALVLRGQIDLLFVDGEGAVNVVDYKHASAAGQDEEPYRFQLLCYALAARRVLPAGTAIRVGLVWLRDRGAATVLRAVPDAELGEHERTLAGCADLLSDQRGIGVFPKLPSAEGCGACGFRGRCWEDRP